MMRTHKLHGVELQLKPYEESSVATARSEYHDILEVSGLPDGISEGLIELYFENSKSGGCADAVKDITFVRPGVARVQFTSDTGITICHVNSLVQLIYNGVLRVLEHPLPIIVTLFVLREV